MLIETINDYYQCGVLLLILVCCIFTKMGGYFTRFKDYATKYRCGQSLYASYIGALLRGHTFKVIARIFKCARKIIILLN